ncbi:M23 family metallopeptidase [Arthrobacter sp. TMN-50]
MDFGAPCGTPVHAADAGTVRAVGWHPWGGGNRVEIDHGNGLITTYNHLEGISVKAGDTVAVSQVVAAVGTTGSSTGCHLHFETIRDGSHVDPKGWTLTPLALSAAARTPGMTSYAPGEAESEDSVPWVIALPREVSSEGEIYEAGNSGPAIMAAPAHPTPAADRGTPRTIPKRQVSPAASPTLKALTTQKASGAPKSSHSFSPSPSATPSHSPSAAPPPSPSHSPSHSPSAAPPPSPSHSPSHSPSAAPSPSPSHSPSHSPSAAPSPSHSPSPSPSPPGSPGAPESAPGTDRTPPPEVAPTPSPSPTPSAEPSPEPTPAPAPEPAPGADPDPDPGCDVQPAPVTGPETATGIGSGEEPGLEPVNSQAPSSLPEPIPDPVLSSEPSTHDGNADITGNTGDTESGDQEPKCEVGGDPGQAADGGSIDEPQDAVVPSEDPAAIRDPAAP